MAIPTRSEITSARDHFDTEIMMGDDTSETRSALSWVVLTAIIENLLEHLPNPRALRGRFNLMVEAIEESRDHDIVIACWITLRHCLDGIAVEVSA